MAKLTPEELKAKLQRIIDASDGIEFGYLEIWIEQGHITTVDGYKRTRTVHDGRDVQTPRT